MTKLDAHPELVKARFGFVARKILSSYSVLLSKDSRAVGNNLKVESSLKQGGLSSIWNVWSCNNSKM